MMISVACDSGGSLEVGDVLLGGPDLLHLRVHGELLDAALVQQAICDAQVILTTVSRALMHQKRQHPEENMPSTRQRLCCVSLSLYALHFAYWKQGSDSSAGLITYLPHACG